MTKMINTKTALIAVCAGAVMVTVSFVQAGACAAGKAGVDGCAKEKSGTVAKTEEQKAACKAACEVKGKDCVAGDEAKKAACKMKSEEQKAACKAACEVKGKDCKADSAEKEVAAVIAQTECPVMGGAINKAQYADVDGKRIYVCCKGCIGTVKKDPAKYIAALEAKGITLESVDADVKKD